MKSMLKGIAGTLAFLAALASAGPAGAMPQAAAAAGASTTVNDMSYVYPMDCGLVYDTACTLW